MTKPEKKKTRSKKTKKPQSMFTRTISQEFEEKRRMFIRHCPHQLTETPAFSADALHKYPYRPSVMTLLRKIQVSPTDYYCQEPYEFMPTVYGSYQQHWSPEINVPVITFATVCDASIGNPRLSRCSYRKGEISLVAVSKTGAAYTVDMEFPLNLLGEPEVRQPLKLLTRHAHRHQDTCLISYSVTDDPNEKPYAIINIWNFGHTLCMDLHKQSVVEVEYNVTAGEHYVLGLTGFKDITFEPTRLDKHHKALGFLDSTDRHNIGYYRCLTRTLPKLDTLIDETIKPTKRNIIYDISKDQWNTAAVSTNHPSLYPIVIPMEAPKISAKKPSPLPPGYFNQRLDTTKEFKTVEDAVKDFQYTFLIKQEHLLEKFMRYYRVKSIVALNKGMNKRFDDFLLQQCDIHKVMTDINDVAIIPDYIKNLDLSTWECVEYHPYLGGNAPAPLANFAKTATLVMMTDSYYSDSDDEEDQPRKEAKKKDNQTPRSSFKPKPM